MATDAGIKPLHQTWKHQRKVTKLRHITSSDMERLDEIHDRVFQLKAQHDKLWKDYGLYGV